MKFQSLKPETWNMHINVFNAAKGRLIAKVYENETIAVCGYSIMEAAEIAYIEKHFEEVYNQLISEEDDDNNIA